ncbi:MAG: hypothetical protein KDC43_00555 [Saprospiraceae bacterium]|nr:hypothetical protein [Saprospiraceae bacterium]MCB0622431.1 hypothetical protein [Saprospiraceae bacterium]MCB0676369.1 hypothetical protein [Saprospiraceae bacterium]MCB0680411.1 hypothetical protein [Saprospiraceae bacterium]
MQTLLPILALALLAAGWAAVQLLARKLGTKNHIEHSSSCCGSCQGGICRLEENKEP